MMKRVLLSFFILILMTPLSSSGSIRPTGDIITAVDMSPNSKMVAVVHMTVDEPANTTDDYTLSIYKKDGSPVAEVKDIHQEYTPQMVWLNDSTLVTGSFDEQIKVWTLSGSQLTLTKSFDAAGAVYNMDVLNTSTVVYSTTSSGVWVLDLNYNRSSIITDIDTYEMSVNPIRNLVAYSNSSHVEIYDMNTKRRSMTLNYSSLVLDLSWNHGGDELATSFYVSNYEKTPKIFNIDTNITSRPVTADYFPRKITWSPDDSQLLTYVIFSRDNIEVSLWDFETMQLLDYTNIGGTVEFVGDGTILEISHENTISFLAPSELFTQTSTGEVPLLLPLPVIIGLLVVRRRILNSPCHSVQH